MHLARLTRDIFTALPVDRRALELLRAMTDGEPMSFFNNRGSVRRELETQVWQDTSMRASRAFEEAFAWLEHRGLVAREPSQESPDWFFVTQRGWDAVQGDEGIAREAAAARLGLELHPLIADRVRSQYLLGEREAAAFLAMRTVEIRVREMAGAGDEVIGVNLMKQAFAETGPLSDAAQEPGERQATMALFWGAIGVFKNPSSHREVGFDDPTMASEVILLADLLLRMLDRIEER